MLLLVWITSFSFAQGQVPGSTRVVPRCRLELRCESLLLLSQVFEVGDDGVVDLPIIGTVMVAGSDAKDAGRILTSLLQQRNPSASRITVRVLGAAGTQIGFSGAVRNSGAHPFTDGIRLADVLALAVPTASADLDQIQILHRDGLVTIVRSLGLGTTEGIGNPPLAAGDIVYVPALNRAIDVFVLGEVKTPGRIDFFMGMKASDALALAGGGTGNADLSAITLERKGVRIDTINLTAGYNAEVQAGDVLRVPARSTRIFITITGDVWNPGPLPYEEGIRLTEALKRAGGLRPGNAGDMIFLARREKGNLKRTRYRLKDIAERKQENPILMPEDTVEVEVPKRRPENR